MFPLIDNAFYVIYNNIISIKCKTKKHDIKLYNKLVYLDFIRIIDTRYKDLTWFLEIEIDDELFLPTTEHIIIFNGTFKYVTLPTYINYLLTN